MKTQVQSKRVKAFLNDLVEVQKKHGLLLSHEDGHGAFEVYDFSEEDDDYSWLLKASDKTNE